MRAVVLGIGNILLSDDGIGVHAVNALAAGYDLPPEVEVIDGGTSAMDCLDQIAGADLLVIADCMRSGREIGGITRLEGDELHAFFRTRLSPHQIGLADVMAAMQLRGIAPERTVLIGVEPESLEVGTAPTPRLAKRVPAMAIMLAAELMEAGLDLMPKLSVSEVGRDGEDAVH